LESDRVGFGLSEIGHHTIVDGIGTALLFDKTPKTPVVAQPYPRFLESNAAAGYSTPPADGLSSGHLPISAPYRVDDEICGPKPRLS